MLAVFLSFLVLVVFYSPFGGRGRRTHTPLPINQTAGGVNSPGDTSALEPSGPTAEVFTQPTKSVEPTQTYELANEIFSVKFTNLGAGVSEFLLKESVTKKAGAVSLIKPIDSLPAFAVSLPNQSVALGETRFKLERLDPENAEIDFVTEIPGELKIRKNYTLIPHQSAFRLSVGIENLSDRVRQIPLELVSQIYFGKEGARFDQDQLESFIVPKVGKIQVIKESRLRKGPLVVSEGIDWQALTRRYFTVIVKPQKEAIAVESKLSPQHDALEAVMKFAPESLEPRSKFETSFLVYAGPEYYEDLKSFGFGFEQTLMQGTWGLVRHGLFFALRFCHKLTGNYGFAILLLTLLVKILFSPFTHMSFESMRKMQVIQPKLKAIQTQFKNDPTRLNKEMMELYKRHKVNPMGGCLPMLIQIPVFISFYQVLAQFVELKGESLWWIKDLTQPDHLAKIPYVGLDLNLLPLLMIGTMIWQQKVTPQQTMGSPEQAKMMQFMPIMFGFFFYQLPAGLVLYWTLNNLLTVLHQMFVHKRTPQVSVE